VRISIELGGNGHRHPGTILVIVLVLVIQQAATFYCSGSRQLNHSSLSNEVKSISDRLVAVSQIARPALSREVRACAHCTSGAQRAEHDQTSKRL